MKYVVYENDETGTNVQLTVKENFVDAEYYLKKQFPHLIKLSTEIYNGVERTNYREDYGSERYFVIEKFYRRKRKG